MFFKELLLGWLLNSKKFSLNSKTFWNCFQRIVFYLQTCIWVDLAVKKTQMWVWFCPLCMTLSNPNLEQSKNDRVMEIVSVSLCRLFSTCSLTFLTTKQKTVFLDICLIKPSDKKYDIYSYRITFTIRFSFLLVCALY